MITLNFPPPEFSVKEENGRQWIWDRIRKKYIALTREEWVRQNILSYLCKVKAYPERLISVEKEIRVNNLRKRYDIVVYNTNLQPWMLIECKEPEVPINDTVLRQLLQYYNTIQCPYWMLTNGVSHYCAAISEGKVTWLSELPAYNG